MYTKEPKPLPPIILLDGGLGTTLSDNYGCVFDDSTPLWSSQLLLTAEGQRTLHACQGAFVRAGADAILTATYQLNAEVFEDDGVGAEKMRDAVKIARDAFAGEGRHGKVVLGLGAYGATMRPSQEYSGNYGQTSNVNALRNFHITRLKNFLPRAKPLHELDRGTTPELHDDVLRCWQNVDLVAFETLPKLEEIHAVRLVMADVKRHTKANDNCQKGFWISCVFPGEEMCLPDGSTVAEVMSAMLATRAGTAEPMGVGINCTKVSKLEALIKLYESAIESLIVASEVKKWPSLVVYPDGTNGEIYNTTTREWEKHNADLENPLPWDEIIYNIVNRARSRARWESIYVGGCCMVSPSEIAKLRGRLDHAKSRA